jgi:N-glycosylase/DNA lyase
MREIYGVTGSYDKVASYARRHFGRFAGYAQEYLYISEDRSRKVRASQCTPGTRSWAP